MCNVHKLRRVNRYLMTEGIPLQLRIGLLCDACGVDYTSIANDAGVHRSTLYQVLRGKFKPNNGLREAFKKHLGFDPLPKE